MSKFKEALGADRKLIVSKRNAPAMRGRREDVALKLSAFNQRVTSELSGSVSEISADL
ncbi:hypothetical protein NKI38_06965 [Mesorhizobium sp. M0621]|uniref:hypothetical protein n=1 Tax=Mesorhizobium sp. M0621 TaxID=2956974 RepID=UPI00333BA897